MLRVAMVGGGAMAAAVLEIVGRHAGIEVHSLVVGADMGEAARQALARLAPGAPLVAALPQAAGRPDLLVECASHSALAQHVVPALEQGIRCIVASVGALADRGTAEALEAAALRGGTQVHLVAGAIGGIDALAAARLGGLDAVSYTGRKPPEAWKGTPAEQLGLASFLTEETTIFEGSAREAARLYPKNANVAATVSLAGLGLDATRVRLVSDPHAGGNVHHVAARGAFGSFEITMRGQPLPSNPKTSALAAYSVARAILGQLHPVVV